MMPAAECFECLKRHMGKRRHCLIHGELPAYVKNEWQQTYLDCSATRSASVGLSALFVGFLHTRCRFLTRDCCPANIPEGKAGFLFIVAQEGMNHRCVSFSPTLSYISTSSVPRTRFVAPCPQCIPW